MKKKTTSLSKSASRKPKRPKQYFVIFNREIFVVSSEFFDVEVQNYDQALQFGMACYGLLQTSLKDEVIGKKAAKINGIKLTTGLTRSLDELDRRFPFILNVIRSHDVSFHGQKVFKC